MVALVFTSNGVVDYYLPEGKWTNFFTGKIVDGGKWIKEKHNYMSLPLMVRPNSVIAVGANEKRPDYDYADGVTFHVFELQNDKTISTTVPTTEGKTAMTIEVSCKGQVINIKTKGSSNKWQVLLRGIPSIKSIEGGKARKDKLGTLLTPAKGTNSITVNL